MERIVGRYSLHGEIASGGMATVYLARQRGEQGFSRVVAIKMLHAQYAKEEAFRAMFLDEARLVSRIRHPSVVATLDVLEDAGDLFLVMEYVHGASLSGLLRSLRDAGGAVPPSVAIAIAADALEGLNAAHDAKSEQGAPLDIVHRDVSPQNVLVGIDGGARIADFGVAKAVGRLAEKFSVHHTVKGKAGYMAPEQLRGKVNRRTDVYAMGVVLWEALTGGKLYSGESFLEIVAKSMDGDVQAPSRIRPDVPDALDAVVLKALSRSPDERYATARDMAIALEQCLPRASPRAVGEWVHETDKVSLARRAEQISRIESATEEERQTHPDPIATPQDQQRTETGVTSFASFAPTPATPADAEATPSRTVRTSRTLALVLTAAVLAGAGTLWVRKANTEFRSPPALAKTEPSDAVPPVVMPSAQPSAMLVVSASDSAMPVASSVASAAAPLPAPRSRAKKSLPITAASTPAPGVSCHWEQLPDEQGIFIPKKVCQ